VVGRFLRMRGPCEGVLRGRRGLVEVEGGRLEIERNYKVGQQSATEIVGQYEEVDSQMMMI
jgi:hypothetical protein